ncbi:MAG TPA: phosphotransferase [Candidatus Saccharimonadales bacterium]|nr:phosphotransferase [Candidatus Saccharimonadales bacterium]
MEIVEQPIREWLYRQLGTNLRIERHDYSNQDDVYKIHSAEGGFYLKINLSLKNEYDSMLRIQHFLSTPKAIGFTRIAGKEYLLMTEVPGNNLAELVGEWRTDTIIREFAKAVRLFHTLSVTDVFPESDVSASSVVLHGDMSFPNVIFSEPGSPSYIDLGQVSIGSLENDLADALWSVQRNLGPGYGEQFLEEYGDVAMTEKIDKALKFRHS